MKKRELDNKYHVAILDPKSGKVVGGKEQFETLEEVLGFLHKFEEPENLERMLTCLMGLRDGECEVVIQREMFQIGEQILKIRPPKRFHKLFWTGFGLDFKT